MKLNLDERGDSMNKKVAVLLSTYNGEKYVKEQLDSILNQSYKNIEIVIRDDGSKDNTVNIIKEYQKKYNNITVTLGKNLGFIKSFFELLKIANAEYYSFADQDDIWLENKIELAVKSLNKLDSEKPNMTFSNVDYYDIEMNFIGNGESGKTFSFKNSLYECVTQGMTMVINDKAKDIIINNLPEKCFFHDWWTYMICSSLGQIAYDDIVTVKYRRDKKNATAEGQGIISVFTWRVKKLLMGEGIKDIRKQQQEFKRIFYNKLSGENKKILDLFAYEKYNLKKALKKAFYPKRIRRKMIHELVVRLFFIVGIL